MLHQELIPQVKAIRYLGVHIQDNLKWHTHIDMITTKSSTTLGFVKRTIPPQSSQLHIRAYKQLVRPVLEYAFCSWNPLPKTLSTRVKAVQQRSARVSAGNEPLSPLENLTGHRLQNEEVTDTYASSELCTLIFEVNAHPCLTLLYLSRLVLDDTTFSTKLNTIRPRLTCQHSLSVQVKTRTSWTHRTDSSASLASPLVC